MTRLTLVLPMLLGALALVVVPLEAQKNCRKGVPCGNTCISSTKVCRLDRGRTAPSTNVTLVPRTEQAKWVALSRGRKCYLSTCAGAGKLSRDNRIYFKTKKEAEAAGYSRSSTKGC